MGGRAGKLDSLAILPDLVTKLDCRIADLESNLDDVGSLQQRWIIFIKHFVRTELNVRLLELTPDFPGYGEE